MTSAGEVMSTCAAVCPNNKIAVNKNDPATLHPSSLRVVIDRSGPPHAKALRAVRKALYSSL